MSEQSYKPHRSKRKLTDYRRKYLRFKISETRRLVKLQCIEYKGGKCEICNYNKCSAALVFHHINPKEKDFAISESGISRKFERCKPELDKCMMLCQNCHVELHQKEHDENRLNTLKELEEESPVRIKDKLKSASITSEVS